MDARRPRRTTEQARREAASPRSPLLPGLDVLRTYRLPWLRWDLLAGLSVAAYLVPQCMAYAELAGLPAVVGLWAIILPLVAYAFIGTSRRLSVGPESTTSILVASALAPLAAGDPARYAVLAAGLAILVGLVFVAAYVLRLGFLADLLSHPILVGFMAGVAVLMIVSQLGRLTGISLESDAVIDRIPELVRSIGEINVPTVILSASVLGLLLAIQRWLSWLPGPLIAVLAATAATVVLGLQDQGVAVVGEIPSGLPTVQVPDVGLADLGQLGAAALGIALIGYTDTILTARAFAARSSSEGEKIDGNQELLALGAANIGAGLTQGYAVSSSSSRTAIIDVTGGRTQVSGLVAAGAVVAVLLVLRGLLEQFPTAALGAIVVYAALRLIQWGEFRRLGAFRSTELGLAVAAFLGVILFNVLIGVLVAVGLSVIDLLARVARPHDAVLGRVPNLAGLHNIDDFPGATTVPGLVVYRFDAPLCFANATDFHDRALAAVAAEDAPVEWFLLNAEAIVDIDLTAADALRDVRNDLDEQGVVFAMARVKQDLRAQLKRAGLLDVIGEDHIFPTLPTALQAFETHRERSAAEGRPAGGDATGDPAASMTRPVGMPPADVRDQDREA
jgi:SulP family sulfate permease